jgi:hypothetical protein
MGGYTLNDKIIYEDIFEAIRKLEEGNPVINLKDKEFGYLKRNLYFNVMEMPDGTIGAFPPNMFIRYFRGENKDYDELYPCVPSIFRTNKLENIGDDGFRKLELILIDELKLIEFELIMEKFPQVKYAVQDYCKVDFRALAQHYELNTNLVDVTSDIATAAFFATHYYESEKKEYRIKEKGIGCLRVYSNIMIDYEEDYQFRMIGLQPFKRPGLQCAFAVKLNKGENFANLSHKVLFKQSLKWNQKLHDTFYPNGKNILFPDEEIVDVAKILKESMLVSKFAIERYCIINEASEEQVIKVLNDNDYSVVEDLNYKLSRQQRRKLERKFEGRPYGDVQIRSRLIYRPPN